jgi:hypothetical protein
VPLAFIQAVAARVTVDARVIERKERAKLGLTSE